jgi:O-antigen ligase
MSVNIRLKHYSDAWQLFKQKPLFGMGTGGFPGGYPHNIFLEIAAENGLLGLVIFLCFLFTVCQRGYQFLNKNIIKNNKQAKIIGLIVLVVGILLFIERQFSFRLDMHKDLFVFFGLIINLPSLNHSYKMKDISGELINDKI